MKLALVMLMSGVMILAGCSGENGGPVDGASDKQSSGIHERSFEPYYEEHGPGEQPELSEAEEPEAALEEESPYTGPAAQYIRKLGASKSSTRDRAADRLVDMGEEAVDMLIAALKDRDGNVRANAAWVLGQIKDKRAVEPLIETVRDKSSKVRSYAALALGKIGDERAIPVLNSAADDMDRDVRLTAKQALAKLEPEKTPLPSKTALKGLGPEAVMRAYIGALASKNPAALYDCISSRTKRTIESQLARIKSSSG